MSTPFSSGLPSSNQYSSQPFGLGGPGDVPESGLAMGVRGVVGKLAWPMVFVGSLWFGLGHVLLGGGGGWMAFIGLLFGVPIYGTVTLVSAILVTIYARKSRRWAAGPWQTWFMVPFYLLTVVYPLTVPDFGDSGPVMPSRLTVWFGLSQHASERLTYSLWWVMTLVALLMIIAGIFDLVMLNQRLKTERFAQYGEFGPQGYDTPQGYNGPQGYNAPQGYDTPQNYDGPQGYNGPQGYEGPRQ